MAEIFQNNVEMSQNSAILLLSAIISNTLNFKGSVTTDRKMSLKNYLPQLP